MEVLLPKFVNLNKSHIDNDYEHKLLIIESNRKVLRVNFKFPRKPAGRLCNV